MHNELVLEPVVIDMTRERVSTIPSSNWLLPNLGSPDTAIMLKERTLSVQDIEECIPGDINFHEPLRHKRPRWKLKGCHRCGGDLHWDDDEYTCLWCGGSQG